MPDIIQQPSANHNERVGCTAPQFVVLHYTGMQDGAMALQRLCDPASKVSAHYLVEEDGRVFQLVDDARRAWHAGVSHWRGIEDINSHSLGIEIVNPGHEFGYRRFPTVQMEAVRDLCLQLKARHNLADDAFLAHSDVAPARKEDPGELFDWPMLAQVGVGLLPLPVGIDEEPLTHDDAAKLLARFGYAPITDKAGLEVTLRAFQRHYVPGDLSGDLTTDTPVFLRSVVRMAGR